MSILPPATLPDDPSRPTDPTWTELEAQLREAGLDWADLTSWTIAPMPEDLDLLPGELLARASVAGNSTEFHETPRNSTEFYRALPVSTGKGVRR